MSAKLLVARGLKCPLPVMLAARALRGLPAGALLKVLATDPLAAQDFRDFCASEGHELVEARETAEGFEGLLRAGPSS